MNMKQVEQDMIRKANEYRTKSMEEDAKLIMTLAEAMTMILDVANIIQDRHKYDLYPITSSKEKQ
jgi:hypothetical protein